MKKFYLVAVIILIAGLLATGCAQKVDLTNGKQPEQIVQGVINNSHGIKSYSFESYIHSTMDIHVRGKVSAVIPAVEYYDIFHDNKTDSIFSIYMRGSSAYIRSTRNQWSPVEGNPMDRGALEIYLNQISSVNPTAVLPEIYKYRSSIKRLKDEKVNGHNTEVIEIITDGDKIAAEQGKFKPAAGQAIDNVQITLWVGKYDLLVYRYYVKGNMVNNQKPYPITITTTLSGYDKTDVTPPEEVKNLQVKI